MSDYTQWTNLLLLLILAALVDRTIKLPALRKWFGLCLLVTGPALLFYATSWIREAHLESLPVVAFVTGIGLLSTQNLYCKAKTSHHLTTAPTMNLAPNFPEDPVMQQLLQLLHEEIGLPKHKTIRLQTSLNFDLGCDGSEAKQLMEALEQEFALDLGDYDTYRYFNPPVFDVFLKRRSKGHGDKVPLTIGMLYLAIKTHSWDTQTLENLS
ncbi:MULTISPECIES: DUF1493 family protein [Pseudomonas]|jgi:hypothetical protein|uniref:DUF1493 family protein n=1 Tax=Pseudomonas TaxID=286 RepID=UPI00185C0B31|nr:DUF1493 family protein [Pseudomonas rhodesiae]MBB4816370.1 hypothetical protein [Pseudomonas rhodesiae]